jgi:hypothetical protein
MVTRIFLAGVLGGIAMFIWSTIAHMFLPLGETGVREIPDEPAVVGAMKSGLKHPGFYIFPGLGAGGNPSREQRSEAMKRMAETYPEHASGILIYHPPGSSLAFGRMLGVEFITEVIEAILVVFLLVQTRIQSFGGRVGFVLIAGILAAITTNIPYWNWYGFPSNYTAAYMFVEIVGFLCAGVVAALLFKNRPLLSSVANSF